MSVCPVCVRVSVCLCVCVFVGVQWVLCVCVMCVMCVFYVCFYFSVSVLVHQVCLCGHVWGC